MWTMAGWNEAIKKTLGGCGRDVFIGHHVVFTNPAQVFLGDRVRIDPFSLVTTQLVTADNVQICSHVVISGGGEERVSLGSWTFLSYGVKLFCSSEDQSGEHGPVNEWWGRNRAAKGPIVLEDYAGVSAGSIVMPNIRIPQGCTIGAMSFVYRDRDLTPWSVFLGNPLRFHKKRNRDTCVSKAGDSAFLKER